MGGSLRDQMLKAGLTSKKKAKAAETEARKEAAAQRKETPRDQQQTDVEKAHETARRLQAERAQKDRERAAREKAEREAQERLAQVRDLVKKHRIEVKRPTGPYYFEHAGATQSLAVSDEVRQDLGRGKVGVLLVDGAYIVVPSETAQRAAERLPEALALLHDRDSGKPAGPEDPYAEYPIPDDLVW